MVSGQPDLPGPKQADNRGLLKDLLKDTERINKISSSTNAFSKVSADICSCNPHWFHANVGCVLVVLCEVHRNLKHSLMLMVTELHKSCLLLLLLTDCWIFFRALSYCSIFIYLFISCLLLSFICHYVQVVTQIYYWHLGDCVLVKVEAFPHNTRSHFEHLFFFVLRQFFMSMSCVLEETFH